MAHRGKIVASIVRRSGYTITQIAKKLGVSRNTIYNRFDNPDLSYRFIMEISKVIPYDFSIDFPQIKDEQDLVTESPLQLVDRATAELWKAEASYIELLEKYTKLLGILAKLSNENTLEGLKKEILEFIEQEERLQI